MREAIQHYQSIPKDFISKNLNEDRIRCEDNFVAIADGAGGTGIYCGEWAEFLLVNLPNHPITNYASFEKWFTELQEPFLEKHEQSLVNDGHKKRRFYEEGSSSTLAVVWQIENEIHWLSYGDSQIFFLDESSYKSYPYTNFNEFEATTDLLNWKHLPKESALFLGKMDIDYTKVILATDTIAKHIFMLLESNSQTDAIFQRIQGFLKNVHNSIAYIKALPDLEEDDYSIITWQPKPFL